MGGKARGGRRDRAGLPGRTEAQFHTQRVMTPSVQSGAGTTSVMAIGFDYMGAGDVDRSKEKPAEKKQASGSSPPLQASSAPSG